MELLQSLIDNSQFPIFTAFLLGIMTAISPCPLATNISAIGYIGKDVQDRRRVFYNGVIYTLGRAISYTILGIILIMILKQGTSVFKIQRTITTYSELFIGPLILAIGIMMLGVIRINLSLPGRFTEKAEKGIKGGNYLGALMLGVVFALAFCPYSAILYFGGLIPVSVSSTMGYFLPLVFAIATGLPVIIFAWILAFSMSSVGNVYNNIKTFEIWFRRIVSVVFIVVGIYLTWMVYF
jgi:cytochrome c-type biogenesis protein